MNIPHAIAIYRAQQAMQLLLTRGVKQYGVTHRYLDGRWDVYSMDIGQWHILINDGGKIVYAMPCRQKA
jgi:hypothetical protein